LMGSNNSNLNRSNNQKKLLEIDYYNKFADVIQQNILNGKYFVQNPDLINFETNPVPTAPPPGSRNPELINEETSQEILEILVLGEKDKKFRDVTIHEKLTILFEQNPNPNTIDSQGKYILLHLAEQGYYDLVLKLLNMGAYPQKSIIRRCIRSNMIIHDYTGYNVKNMSYAIPILEKSIPGCELFTIDEQVDIFKRYRTIIEKSKMMRLKFKLNALYNFCDKLIIIKTLSLGIPIGEREKDIVLLGVMEEMSQF
jgi:ankyrin repeat protein